MANPDLVRRYRVNLPLNSADQSTFYGGGEAGYTDYSFYRSEYVSGPLVEIRLAAEVMS